MKTAERVCRKTRRAIAKKFSSYHTSGQNGFETSFNLMSGETRQRARNTVTSCVHWKDKSRPNRDYVTIDVCVWICLEKT